MGSGSATGASGATTRGGTPAVGDGSAGGMAGVPGLVERAAGVGAEDGLTGATGAGLVPGLVAVAAGEGASLGLRPFGPGAGATVCATALPASINIPSASRCDIAESFRIVASMESDEAAACMPGPDGCYRTASESLGLS